MATLNLNHSPLKQPEGTTRFNLNAVSDIEHLGSDANELGTILCTQLNAALVGPPILIDRERFALCLNNNSIWILNVTTCEAIQHCQVDCFGWDTLDYELYPVTGTHRVVRGCEDIIYLFNGLTKDLFVNLSRPEKQQTNGEFDCTKFEFNPCIVHSTIDTEILNVGGQMEYGTYNFAIEYLTSNKDSLFVTPVDINYTPIIYQVDEGALNLATNLPDIGGKPKSSKSIKLTISNVPEDAVLARVVVFRHITGDGFTSDAHVVGELIPVNGSTLEYVYRGFNVDNGDYLIDKNEYLTPRAIYESSLNAVQVNNRLVRYTLKESTRDYNTYQAFASKICSKYVVKDVLKNDANFYRLNQTFLGGEIILPCITYVHCDGTVSNAYPLIGRPKNTNDEILVDDIFNNNQQVEKWLLYDTSIKDSTPIDGYVSSGEFGYYESTQLYSNPPNYCGSNYWGFDCNGNNLEDSPVRLFVVPDRSVEKHEDINYIQQGNKRGKIYPIGIWFDESTIEYPNDDIVSHYFTMVVVNDSNIKAKGIGINSQYVPKGLNQIIKPSLFPVNQTNSNVFNFLSGEGTILENFVNGTHIVQEGQWDWGVNLEDETFKKLFNSGLPYDQIHVWLREIFNDGYTSLPDEVQKLNSSLLLPSLTVIDNKGNNNLTTDFTILETPTTFQDLHIYRYLSVKNYINPIPNIWSIQTRRITDLGETVSFNGDNFITPLNIDSIYGFKIENEDPTEEIIKFIRFGVYAFFIDNEGLDLDAYADYINGFYTESKVNTTVRHEGSDVCNKTTQNVESQIRYFLDKMIEPYNENYKLRDSFCKFFPGYNKDYSYIQQLNRYNNISFVFDFCSECTGLYPHRLTFSPQSFSEDLADQYRINRANDYIDVPSNTGSIVAVDYKDNKLVIRTERSCYFLQPNPQQMETSESNVYIGTGDFLSIPPQELSISQPGYGAQQHKLDSINTERGLIWSDRQRGEVYLLGGEFKEISSDMNKWFGDNLSNVNHLIFGYDPVNNRVLMTGKNSWTLSYSFDEQGWKSWHSYIPDWYMYNANTFYSVTNNGIWEHNKGKYTTYYGLEFPHVVETIIKGDGNTILPQSIIYHANVYDTSNGYDQDVIDITYDQFIAYNDVQSTGFQNLALNELYNVSYIPTTTHVKQTDRNYKIGQLKDLAIDSNIWTTNISSIKQGVHGYYDKLPVVDVNKPMTTIGDFRSKWIGVRLIFNNHDYKISLEFENTNSQISKR